MEIQCTDQRTQSFLLVTLTFEMLPSDLQCFPSAFPPLSAAFKKRFGLAITLKWQSSSRPKHEEPPRPSKTPPSSPPKPPRCSLLDSPRPPLHLAQRQLPAFSRAVRAPSPMVHAAPESPRGATMVPPVDAAALLQGVCEVYGQGKPLYDLQYRHMGPDGFLCFSYQVNVSGLATPFTGMVQTLPGPNPGAIQEARRATAQQVLSALCRAYITPIPEAQSHYSYFTF